MAFLAARPMDCTAAGADSMVGTMAITVEDTGIGAGITDTGVAIMDTGVGIIGGIGTIMTAADGTATGGPGISAPLGATRGITVMGAVIPTTGPVITTTKAIDIHEADGTATGIGMVTAEDIAALRVTTITPVAIFGPDDDLFVRTGGPKPVGQSLR